MVDFSKLTSPVDFLVLIMLWRSVPPEHLPRDVFAEIAQDSSRFLSKMNVESERKIWANLIPQLMDELHLLNAYHFASKKDADYILKQVFNQAAKEIYSVQIENVKTERAAYWLNAVVETATNTFMRAPNHFIRKWYSVLQIFVELRLGEISPLLALSSLFGSEAIIEAVESISKPPEVEEEFARQDKKRKEKKKDQEAKEKEKRRGRSIQIGQQREMYEKRRREREERKLALNRAGCEILAGNISEAEKVLMEFYNVPLIDSKIWIRLATSPDRLSLDNQTNIQIRSRALCLALDLDVWSYDNWTHLSNHLKFLNLEKAARGAKDMAEGKPSITRGDQKQLGEFLLEHGSEKAAYRVLGPNQ